MTGTDRFERVEQLYHAALERKEDDRKAFLASACAGDDALLREVESLLGYEDEATGFIEEPAVEGAARRLGRDLVESRTRELRLRAGMRLGSYEILAPIDAGGMGEVYRARDARLEREVAVKVLTGDAPGRDRVARFEREARAAGALNHPNVLTVHDVGTHEGAPYLVTELLNGKTLRERLQEGPLPLRKAVEIAVQLARGLSAAHEKGIVHRDLKPANVFLAQDGRVKILDFGLAHVTGPVAIGLDAQSRKEPERLTAAGTLLGTIAYMSPEQVRQQDVDARSDVFSLGTVLYEMLGGRRPFVGATPADTLSAILHADPPPIETGDRPLPKSLDRVVCRCLEKEAAERFQSARDVGFALEALSESPETAPTRVSRRRVVVGLALLAPLLVAAVAWQAWRSRQPDAGPIRSLAVLPFANLSADAEQEYLADGITDALITELAGIRSLRVISRQSVIRYKDSAKSMPEIARELGVDGIVEGAVLRSGSRVRVSAQVVHGPRDEHLWARSFEGAAGDMLPLQAEIARAVASGVRVKLTAPEQARFAQAADVDPEAYDLYLRGRYYFNRRFEVGMEADLLKCASYMQQAVQKDPRFALAHATLAFCYFPLANAGLLPPWEAPGIEKHARKALELDPELSDGRLALAESLFLQLDWAGADAEYRKAVESNPGDAHARQSYSFFLMTVGRFDEALTQSAQGMRIDPFQPWLSRNHLWALFELGRGEEALARARQIMEIEGPITPILGKLYLRLGREQEALAEFERVEWEEGIARIRALRGDPSGLRALLGRLQERAQQRYVSPVQFALLHTALGEKDAAFSRLEEAYRTKAPGLKDLKTSWEFTPLRSDPRWVDLVHRLKLG